MCETRITKLDFHNQTHTLIGKHQISSLLDLNTLNWENTPFSHGCWRSWSEHDSAPSGCVSRVKEPRAEGGHGAPTPPAAALTPLSSVLHERNAFPILYPSLLMAKVAICGYFPKGYDCHGELLMRGPSCFSGKTGEGVFTWPSHLPLPHPATPHPLTLVGLADPPAEPSLSIPLESKRKAGSSLGKSYFIQLANGSHIPWERIQVWNRGDSEAVCVCVWGGREGSVLTVWFVGLGKMW